MKNIGKPCAGKSHARFDQGGQVQACPLLYPMFPFPDAEHSETEERWLTLGQAENRKLLVVIHTYEAIGISAANVRIISARAASKHERRQYELSL